MTKSEYRTFVEMWTKDRNAIDRWLKASAVAGSIFAAAVVIMALSSSRAPGPEQATAIDISASARHSAQSTMSPYELMLQIAPGQIPVQQVDEPF